PGRSSPCLASDRSAHDSPAPRGLAAQKPATHPGALTGLVPKAAGPRRQRPVENQALEIDRQPIGNEKLVDRDRCSQSTALPSARPTRSPAEALADPISALRPIRVPYELAYWSNQLLRQPTVPEHRV